MAYESKVSNKYFGTTFAGTGKVTADTELGQVVDALKSTFSPAAQGFGESYIEKKQKEAGVKMQELYAKHGKDTLKEVMSGKYPELESMYATATKEVHLGKYAASDAFLKYKENQHEYNPETQDLNSFMANFVPKGLENNGKFFASGFGATWNGLLSKELSQDATNRADAALNRDMQEHTVISQSWDVDLGINYYDHTYGEKGSRILSNTRQNQYTRNYIKVGTDQAGSLEDISNLEQVFFQDRGDGRNMLTSGNEDDSKLWQELQNKKTSLIASQQNRKKIENDAYEQAAFTDMFAILRGDTTHEFLMKGIQGESFADKQDWIFKDLLKKNRGDLVDDLNKLINAEKNIGTNSISFNKIKQKAMMGVFNNYTDAQLLQEINSVGGTVSQLEELQKIRDANVKNTGNGEENNPLYSQFFKDYLGIQEGIMMATGFKPLDILVNNQQKRIVVNYLAEQDSQKFLEWSTANPKPNPLSQKDEYNQWLQERLNFKNQMMTERNAILENETQIKALVDLNQAGFKDTFDKLYSQSALKFQSNLTREDILQSSTYTLMSVEDIIKRKIANIDSKAFKAAEQLSDEDILDLMTDDLVTKLGITPDDLKALQEARDNFTQEIDLFLNNEIPDMSPEMQTRVNSLFTKEESAANFPQLRSFLDNFYKQVSPQLEGGRFQYIIQAINDEQWLKLSTGLGLRPEVLKEITEQLYNVELGE